MIIWPTKAPTEVADFAFDFAGSLADAETISTKTIAVDGVTLSTSAIDGSQVQVWLSGGVAGSVAKATATITTSGGRTFAEVAVLPIGGDAISLATAKQAQRIEDDEEDVLLAGFLRAAIGHVERVTGKNLTMKIERQSVDRFPCGSGSAQAIRLWKGPVSEILGVAYDDGAGIEQSLASFRLVEGGTAKLLPAFGEYWPTTAMGVGTVRLTYLAGYDPAELPPELVQAAILLFGHFNANREAVVAGNAAAAMELPLGVKAMIAPYCAPGIA